MNTTFTNYAEKKAKQFLNLLQGYTKGIRMTTILILLLMGVNNAWAEPSSPYASLYEVYMSYSYSGQNGEYTYKNTDNGHVAVNLGTLSADFKITSIYMKVYKNENDWGETGNICKTYLKYKINDGTEQSIEPNNWSNGTWADERHKYEISMTSSTTIAKYNGASGNYNFTHYFKATGDKDGSDCSDEFYISNNGANYLFTYSIAPPAINNFTVTATGHTSGSGTSNDPYIITSGQSLTLSLSGSQAHTDANSSLQYNTEGIWNTTTSRTISNITSTTAKSVTVKMRCHNSSDDLSGTESSETIYYKAAATTPDPEETVTLYFVNKDNWTNLKAHVWDDNNNPYKNWNDSESMTDTGEDKNGYDVYSYTFPSKYNHIIFKGDGNQTGDNCAEYDIAKPYYYGGKWYASLDEIPTSGATSLTIYFRNNCGWNIVNAHAWNDDNSNNGGWPGEVMTQMDNKPEVYYITFDKQFQHIIFNNGSNQTGDLNIDIENNMYDCSAGKWSEYDGSDDDSGDDSGDGISTGVYLVGDIFNSWEKSPTKEFKKATSDANTSTLEVMLEANRGYKIKIIDDNIEGGTKWRGNKNDTFTKDNLEAVYYKETENNNNYGDGYITTDKAGKYIFTWNSGTNVLSVKYPNTVTVTFYGDGGKVIAKVGDEELTSPALVEVGSTINFTYTANEGNKFSRWVNGNATSSAETYTITNIAADATVVAEFIKPTPIFLKPSAAWLKYGARFALYWWNNDDKNGWRDMTPVGCNDEYYTAKVPVDAEKFKFVRMDPENTENNWDNDWNETNELTLPTNGDNLFAMKKMHLNIGEWAKDQSGRFAAYFFNEGDQSVTGKWVDMIKGYDVYYCDIPIDQEYLNVIFCRMNPDKDNGWDEGKVWHQTDDLDIIDGDQYTITEFGGNGQHAKGNWSIISAGEWSKINMPTVTYNTPENGTLKVTTLWGEEVASGTEVDFNTQLIVTFTPNDGYRVSDATITRDGTEETLQSGKQYAVCGETQINVSYVIKEEWYIIGIDDNWSVQEKHQFVDGKVIVELDSAVTKLFKIAYAQGTNIQQRWGNSTFTISSKTATLTQHNNDGNDAKITASIYGKYEFAWDESNHTLTITYPLEVGDYRLAYKDDIKTFHPERVIKKSTSGDKRDIVSFFVRRDKNPQILVQRCKGVDANGIGTWETAVPWTTIDVESTAVYNFVLKQTNDGTNAAIEGTPSLYTGNYYIRTASATNAWKYFRTSSHRMTYSSYADEHEPFSHYFCEWVSQTDKGIKNVKFTIANDYGDCISDTLAADPADANPRIVIAENGDLPDRDPNANVRFAWDWRTNKLTRAYLAGANSNTADTYLRIVEAENLKDENGTNTITEVHFNDLQNWIYEVDVKATKATQVKLTAFYAEKTQYFKGSESTKVSLLSTDADENTTFTIRLTYDFKTNHLIVAWLPDDNSQVGGNLGADMMVIRKHDKNAAHVTQVNLKQDLKKVQTAYAVVSFAEDWIYNTSASTRERSLYWVSFPFDVKVEEAFGFGEYGDVWILQYYDGAARAQYGLYASSGTYWKYITDKNTILEKGVGYVLVLDLSKVTFNHGAKYVSLYFPSLEKVTTITNEKLTDMLVPEHQCSLGVSSSGVNHDITDSNWNIIGIPGFKDITVTNVNTTFNQDDANFYYEFKFSNNGYDVKSAATDFKSMYGYMVQYTGTIKWSAKSVTPDQLAARRNGESELPEKVVLGLELVQGEEKADQTFVQLQQEGATAEFDMNLDLTKIINSGANIYTLTNDRIQAAGNALPMEESVVPVGVQIAAEGEYTFRMPDGTEGMVVELIDYETNTRTNLLLSDYIVTLPKGTSENRFALHIQPQKDAVTGVENIGDGVNNGEAVNKYLIDGKLIIRTAEGIFDAQGKRL